MTSAGGLRAGLSIDEAADVIWATNSSELYVLLTADRGWPPDRYERCWPTRGVAFCFRTLRAHRLQ